MSINSLTHALRGRAATLLLLAFAYVQFIEFAHQHDHATFDSAERCVTCVHFDSFSTSQATPGDALEERIES